MIKIDINKKLHGSISHMNLEVNTTIKQGEFIALAGQSGSGKTTFLRILAGLEKANGSIIVDGKVWQDDKNYLKPQKREIGFVFQDYALFPHMNVEETLLYVKKDKELCEYLLNVTGLFELKKRVSITLSGGQKQRLSLCRAMMSKPKLLLMDEPLSALDPNLRLKLQDEILTLHKEFNTTSIMVSHDLSEIYKLSNRVLIMEFGKIIKDGRAKEVLLKTSGSQKFSFEGEVLDILKVDVIYVATISIGQQLVEVVASENEIKNIKIGQKVRVGTKAFSPIITWEN